MDLSLRYKLHINRDNLLTSEGPQTTMVHHRKSHQRAQALALVRERCDELVHALLQPAGAGPPRTRGEFDALETPWEGHLDPSEGQLDDERSQRKRQQLRSLSDHIMSLLPPASHCVEFGAGSGHLGLLVASLRPDCRVTLVEIKAHSCQSAERRIEGLGLTNVTVFEGSVDRFAQQGGEFDVAVGLHLCGLLTDAVIELATSRSAAVCVVPCCYGQLAGAVDHNRGGGGDRRRLPALGCVPHGAARRRHPGFPHGD